MVLFKAARAPVAITSDTRMILGKCRATGFVRAKLATSNGVSIASVVQAARNANEMTVNSYTNYAERAKGGQEKLKSIGVKIQPNVRPGS